MIANFADLGQKVLFVQMRIDLIGGFNVRMAHHTAQTDSVTDGLNGASF
jgi:hypothetical protein